MIKTLNIEVDKYAFKEIFKRVENTLREQSCLSKRLFDLRFGEFKYLSYKNMRDRDIYWTMVYVAFYSGMRASIVTQKLPSIKKYLYDFRKVKDYSGKEINKFLGDPNVIRFRRKIEACIINAKEFDKLLVKYKSFRNYLESFGSLADETTIEKLRADLRFRFQYLGERTVNHFLTDLGLNVLKPDRVVCRIFKRLRLINHENNIEQAIEMGKNIATATGYPIRYINIVFVKYGQMGEDKYFGLKDGICLKKTPKCYICGIKKYCRHHVDACK